MTELRKIRRVLISLSDKSGAADFAHTLIELGAEIISTGGTARTLREAGIEVTDVSDVTGFPELMDGRVKTLHPKIHGAFLALRDNADHVASMIEHGIEPIDMAVINLYPFERTVAKDDVSLEEAVENIDIGGPAMIRSASKNWRDVAVVTDFTTYPEIVREMKANDGSLSFDTRQKLAAAAFARTAEYDCLISAYLQKQCAKDTAERSRTISETVSTTSSPFPDADDIYIGKVRDLRYGENPHQRAALYSSGEHGVADAEQLHGKEMSFNNYVDADAAWNLVQDFDERAVAIIKHTNPSGVGIGITNEEAYRRALSTDPVSAFGGIVAFNRTVDSEVARSITEIFTEVVVAPDYEDAAIEILRTKKNLRVLRVLDSSDSSCVDYKQIGGGFLVQEKDSYCVSQSDIQVVSTKWPTDDERKAMLLAWRVCKHVKSNAIVIANSSQTLGVGSGQMNRVDSVRIAAMRAERFELPIKRAVLASDAFFPFRDNVDEAARIGISAIIQPGGSIKDEESIAAADEHGIVMMFTGIRHFKH